jgi:YggT family protein
MDFKEFAINFVTVFGNLITYLIFARVILSWFSMGRAPSSGKISAFIRDVTEPFFRIVRMLPHKIGMIDLSPLIALFGVNIITYLLVNLIVAL